MENSSRGLVSVADINSIGIYLRLKLISTLLTLTKILCLLLTSNPPRLPTGAMLILKCLCSILCIYIHTYIHTTHAYLRGGSRGIRYSFETPTFYQNLLAMKNTADFTGGKPIAVLLQSISGVSAIFL
jgi:hypothetical protein